MGTFNSNPLCLAAALASLQELSRDNGQVIHYISEMGAKLRIGLNCLFKKYSFPVKAAGSDPIFVLTSPVLNLRNYRDFLKLDFNFIHHFYEEMLSQGVWFMRRGNMMLSAAIYPHNLKYSHTPRDKASKVVYPFEKLNYYKLKRR